MSLSNRNIIVICLLIGLILGLILTKNNIQVATAASGIQEITFPHYHFFIVNIARHNKIGWLFCRENDNYLACSTLQGGNVAYTNNITSENLIDVSGLGGVRDTEDPNKNRTIEIYSSGRVVEYSLWHGDTYTQGEVSSNATKEIIFPHYKSFIVTIARHDKIGCLFCRENDNYLDCSTLQGGNVAYTYNINSENLIDVSGLGGVRDTGDPSKNRTIEIYSSGSVVEYSLWHGDTYTQGEVSPNAKKEITFPHYKFFIVTIVRHNKIGCLFCRENDNILVCSTLQGGNVAYTYNIISENLIDVSGLGGVRDTGDPSKNRMIEIYSEGSIVEYSLWYKGNYTQGEVSVAQCSSGPCCDTSQGKFKPSGSQPTGYIDNTNGFCDGANSSTGTNYVKIRDYFCNGADANMHYKDTTVDTCGACEYCTDNDLTCNYYSSSYSCGICKQCNGAGSCTITPSDDSGCGIIDCSNWYVQTGTEGATTTENCYNKRDITTNRCEGLGNCKDNNTTDCNSESNDQLQYHCGICKYISSTSCTGTTLGSCSNFPKGTSCGTNKECDGQGNCLTVKPTVTNIRISPDYPYQGNYTFVTIAVKDSSGNKVPGGNVTLSAPQGWFDNSNVTLVNGKASTKWHTPYVSTDTSYQISATYNGYTYGNTRYKTSSGSDTATVVRDPDNGVLEAIGEWVNDYPTVRKCKLWPPKCYNTEPNDLDYCDDCIKGFLDTIYYRGTWGTAKYGDSSARAEHFSSSNNDYVDKYDIALFNGHGSAAWDWKFLKTLRSLWFNPPRSKDKHLTPGDADDKWGDKDLEWIGIKACKVMKDDSYWAKALNGAHLILGFKTKSKSSSTFGSYWADYMIQDTASDVAYTVGDSWIYAADMTQPDERVYLIIGETCNCWDDYLWGQGYVMPDPTDDSHYCKWSEDLAGKIAPRVKAPQRTVRNKTLEPSESSDRTIILNTAMLPDVTSMTSYKVMIPEIEESYVYEIADKFDIQGEVGTDNSNHFWLVDGPRHLTVSMATGAFRYTDSSRLYAQLPYKPQLPSEDVAIQTSMDFLAQRELLPYDAYQSMVKVDYKAEKVKETGEILDYTELDYQIIFNRVLTDPNNSVLTDTNNKVLTDTNNSVLTDTNNNSYIVVGPGSRVKTYIGGDGEVIGVFSVWRKVEPEGSVEIISAEDAITILDEVGSKGTIGDIPYANKIIINDISLGYYAMNADEFQEYLEPVYIFDCDFEQDDITFSDKIYIPSSYVIPFDLDKDGIPENEDNCLYISNPEQLDDDKDGHGAACDCDDKDPNINPEATEVCNYKDDNCDGTVDEGCEETINMPFKAGWSMFSLPVITESAKVSDVFPDAVVVYSYDKKTGYSRVGEKLGEELHAGEGYWILFDQDQDYVLTGPPIHSYSHTAYENGWKMIGGCTFAAQPSTDSCSIGVIYRYIQGIGYKRVTHDTEDLLAGEGYWIQFKDVIGQCNLNVEPPAL